MFSSNPGAAHLVAACKKVGMVTLFVSGGCTLFTDRLREIQQIDATRSNILEIGDGTHGPVLTRAEPVPPKRSPAHYPWAVLSARIYEVFPLVGPLCGGPMRLIAFVTQEAQVSKIVDHIGVDSQPPRSARQAGRRCGMTAMRQHLSRASSKFSASFLVCWNFNSPCSRWSNSRSSCTVCCAPSDTVSDAVGVSVVLVSGLSNMAQICLTRARRGTRPQ